MLKVNIMENITKDTIIKIDKAIRKAENNSERLLIVINSALGTKVDAIAICNLLDATSTKVITLAIGECKDVATLIFSRGDSRYLGKDVDFCVYSEQLKKYPKLYFNYLFNKTSAFNDFNNFEKIDMSIHEYIKYNVATDKFTTFNELFENERKKEDTNEDEDDDDDDDDDYYDDDFINDFYDESDEED